MRSVSRVTTAHPLVVALDGTEFCDKNSLFHIVTGFHLVREMDPHDHFPIPLLIPQFSVKRLTA